MSRKLLIRAALVATPLVAVILYIALNWYRVEYEPFRVGAGPAALRDPFLAYARLLERLGARPTVIRSPSGLESLPYRATLVLAAPRLAYMTPAHVKGIVDWVGRGGRLVVESERWGISDPLLDALGVENVEPPQVKPGQARRMPEATPAEPAGPVSFAWPGADRRLTVSFSPSLADLHERRDRADYTAVRAGKQAVALDFDEGEGHVTILASFRMFTNARIGEHDHATFAWLLMGPRATEAPAMLFLRMDSPPLPEWIWREAWTIVIAACLLLALWLARIIPRFGPLAPDPPPRRRSLAEHIAASGRFLWSRAEGAYLLHALRERAMRAARRRGVPASAPASQAAASIAQLTALPEGAIRAALASTAETDAQFTAAVSTLRDIESRLARRSPRLPRPRRARS